MVQSAGDASHVLPIVQLVRQQVAASGRSLRVFAEERGIPYSTIRYYNDKRLKPLSQPPRQETLRELALALDVPLSDVQQAALESLSYRIAPVRQEPDDPWAMPADVRILLDDLAALSEPPPIPELRRRIAEINRVLATHFADIEEETRDATAKTPAAGSAATEPRIRTKAEREAEAVEDAEWVIRQQSPQRPDQLS